MHSTHSVILTVLELVRGYLDLPDDKYDDDYIVRNILPNALEIVWNGISNTTQLPILSTYEIDVVTTQNHYLLPANIAEVWGLVQYNSAGETIRDWQPRNHFNPKGPGWRIEGNHLTFQPNPVQSQTWVLEYAPGADWYIHRGTGGTVTGAKAFTLGTVAQGTRDPRDQGLAGASLRILKKGDDSVTTVEEHAIATYDASAGTLTTRTEFQDYTTSDSVHYEIVPPGMATTALTAAWGVRAAMILGAMANVGQRQRNTLAEEYRSAIKVVRDRVGHFNQRVPKHIDKNTVDHPNRRWRGVYLSNL